MPRIIQSASHILDVGTGTGVISLLLAKQFIHASIIAVDIHPEAIECATNNIRVAGLNDRISTSHIDFLDADMRADSFDLIVCNPPFYFEQVVSTRMHDAKARHRQADVNEWIKKLLQPLKSGGSVCLVVPYEQTQQWISHANEYGFYCHQRVDVYSYKSDPDPKRVLLQMTDQLGPLTYSTLCIYERPGEFAIPYMEFLGTRNTSFLASPGQGSPTSIG